MLANDTHTYAHSCVQEFGTIQLCGWPRQPVEYIYSEIKVRTDLFNLGQRQNTKAYFYVEFELEVDVQMSQCTRGNAIAFTT